MAIRVPSASESADKWSSVTPSRSQFYQTGVSRSGAAYEEGVANSEDIYNQGVQQAISEGRWATGVSGKGSKYVRKSTQVGVPRWQQGVPAAKQDYQDGVAPILSSMAAVTLPPKGPKRAPQNLQRVAAVNQAAIAGSRR